MALADFIYRLKPESGDSTPHDEKGVSSALSGGTIALADAGGGDYYWQFTGVASASGFSAAVDTNSDSTGITMAARFSVPTYDTVDGFAYLLQALTTGTAYGPSLGQSSANFIRPRVVDTSNVTATALNIGTATRTVVLRFKPTTGLDVLDVWWNGVGSGDTPDYTATGNMNTRTYTRLLAGSANSVLRLFDCVIWGEALSDADCAALADTGIRTTLDAGGDVTAPVLSSPTGTQTGSTTGSGTVSTDEGNGTLYYWATTNATETAADVKTNGATQAVSGTGSQGVTFSGLSPSTTYYAHYVHRDAAGNDSTRVSSAGFTTTAGAAPALSKIIQQMGA